MLSHASLVCNDNETERLDKHLRLSIKTQNPYKDHFWWQALYYNIYFLKNNHCIREKDYDTPLQVPTPYWVDARPPTPSGSWGGYVSGLGTPGGTGCPHQWIKTRCSPRTPAHQGHASGRDSHLGKMCFQPMLLGQPDNRESPVWPLPSHHTKNQFQTDWRLKCERQTIKLSGKNRGKYLYYFKEIFCKTFYFEIIFILTKCCKYSTKTSHISFNQISQMLTFGNTWFVNQRGIS